MYVGVHLVPEAPMAIIAIRVLHHHNTRHCTFIDLGVVGAGRILRIGPAEITKMDSPFRGDADKTNY